MSRLYYSISEVSEMLNIPDSTIRFWEKEFEHFLSPHKSEKGTRRYTEKDIQKIQTIHYLLKDKKLTIPGAINLLKTKGEEVERKMKIINKLKTIKAEIQSVRLELESNFNIQKENTPEEEKTQF